MRGRRFLIWSVLVLSVVGVLVYLFWPRPVAVDVTEVVRGPLAVLVEEDGTTRVRHAYTVSAPLAGRLLRITLDVGDAVVAGRTVIASIVPSDPVLLDVRTRQEADAAVRAAEAARDLADAQVERAQADLDFARAELQRARELVDRGTVSQRTYDEAERMFRTSQAALRTARAELEVRRSELERARASLISVTSTIEQGSDGWPDLVPVHAPVDGRVLEIFDESERVVAPGEPLVVVGDPGDLEIVVDLLSIDAVHVAPGQRVEIGRWGGDETLSGQVRRVEPFGFTKVSALGIEEQRVNVIVDIDSPPEAWQRLGHGYRVEAGIVVWERDDVVKLPLSALFRDGGEWAVFRIDAGRARLTPVEIGRRTDLEAQVLAGVAEGDMVVMYPGDRVADGVTVVDR